VYVVKLQLDHSPTPPFTTPPTPLPDMPRIPAKRRIEDDISEYLVEMADMGDAPDDGILDAIDVFFNDP
jgi:hypothetical protein